MLNFRKLKKEFPSKVLDEGRELFVDKRIVSARIDALDATIVRVSGRVLGQFDNSYEVEVEIDKAECEIIDSNCDCPHTSDCQHLAALVHYLEDNFDKILVEYSKKSDLCHLNSEENLDAKKEIIESLKEAEAKEQERQKDIYEKQVLDEYVLSAKMLSTSPFFHKAEKREVTRADFAFIFNLVGEEHPDKCGDVEVQIALRMPYRSKPLFVPHIGDFIEALRYEEPIVFLGKKYCFFLESFDAKSREIVKLVMEHVRPRQRVHIDRGYRLGYISHERLGLILARGYEIAMQDFSSAGCYLTEDEMPVLPCLYQDSIDTQVRFSPNPGNFQFQFEYLKPPISKLLIKPRIFVDRKDIGIEYVDLLECSKPGMLHSGVYYRFASYVTRRHLRNLPNLRDMAVPEPLFGSLVENALPNLSSVAEISNMKAVENFVTLPYVDQVRASCDLTFLDGELDATVWFEYNGQKIPAAPAHLTYGHVLSFVTLEGIIARNLAEENMLVEEIFQDFTYSPEHGVYATKSEKKIIEFMTDVIPRFQDRVNFKCPQNLLDQFIYDESSFVLELSHCDRVDSYTITMKVDGALAGVTVDLLWECMATRRSYIELGKNGVKGKKPSDSGRSAKILVLDLDRLSGVIKVFDELGIELLDNYKIDRPLWSLANIDSSLFENLPIQFSITDELLDIRSQMLGEKKIDFSPIPPPLDTTLRSYQVEGVQWLERLRRMYLSGILADDMGLGKTLQAIVAILQEYSVKQGVTLIVCPTSLLYNWKEECAKFAPQLRVTVVDGIPGHRKKLIEKVEDYDLIITSYTLLQKDIESYQKVNFSYAILDEAQHIKNRGTRNAKSVKMVRAKHRLILSGTPIENSLDELWSLFDFLMPGFLSTYDRFVEKYIRSVGEDHANQIAYLKKKVAPFIMRRMKSDVLDDLPPVSELLYHCQLSDVQKELYKTYADSARDELSKLVERDGFDRVQIHVLATLTRLKQICCHPAIFAKEKAEPGDSAKYDLLLELLQTLIEGKHKTVIFSQYTKMLQIMRHDFEKMGIKFSYLDGSSKNRLDIVNEFNSDESISVFLVSLKAGGTGLNLVSADTVIHYDIWWNPAIENQATDRVHRLGQKRSVSAYKLITLGTIEEKIAEMQNRKRGLVKKIVSCDDEAISKLTWEDVLELLKT